jgi:hypothetical protein
MQFEQSFAGASPPQPTSEVYNAFHAVGLKKGYKAHKARDFSGVPPIEELGRPAPFQDITQTGEDCCLGIDC